ncbi:MAG: hypothetical protein D6718_08435 [Acidobacteria bacterium]|nr:MAG: hypothetical protein D6718_08435 [Acidobacteriota bacterium]
MDLLMAWGRRPRIGLALGGGAARGLAHLGVLEVLEEEGLAPVAVAGTSVGALIGGIWLTAGSAEASIDRVQAFVRSPDYRKAELEYLSKARIGEPSGWAAMIGRVMRRGVFYGRAFLNRSFVSQEAYRHNIDHLLPDIAIEQLPAPLAVVATDLMTGDPVVFRRGPLRDAVAASGAVPGVMPPQEIDGRVLIDGGLSEKIPARALLAADVDIIVGVDVSSVLSPDPAVERGLEVITRAHQLTEWNLRRTRNALCDVLIRPEVQDINWLNFSGARPAIRRGRAAAERALPLIREALRRARIARAVGLSRRQRAERLARAGWFGVPLEEI